jgi:hypothetical protein
MDQPVGDRCGGVTLASVEVRHDWAPGFRWDDEFGDFVIPMSANNFAARAPPVKRSRAVIEDQFASAVQRLSS